MKVISIVNNKGGVGKTTTAQNLSGAMSSFTEGTVLAIDLDPQNSLSKSLGVNEARKHVGDFLLGKATFNEVKIDYDSKLSLLPASLDLLNQEQQLANSAVFPFNLKLALEKLPQRPDFVIIDCPPSLSVLTRIALVACDIYMIPMQAEYFSYEGLRALINYTNDLVQVNPSMRLGGIFATRYNPNIRKKFSREVIKNIQEQLSDRFFEVFVRENITITEAQASGKHIFDFNEGCKGAEDYHALAAEVLQRLNRQAV